MDLNAEFKAILKDSTLMLSWNTDDGKTYSYQAFERFEVVDTYHERMTVMAAGETLEEVVEDFRKKQAQ